MNKKYIMIATFVLSVFVWSGFSLPVHAGSASSADFLVELGRKAYEKGHPQDAIHEWSKALIIAPDHIEARALLDEFGLKEGLYEGIKTQTDHIAELAIHIRDYEEKTAMLHKSKSELEDKFAALQRQHDALYQDNLAKNMEMVILQEHFVKIKEVSRLQKEVQKVQLKKIEEEFAQKQQDLESKIVANRGQLTRVDYSDEPDRMYVRRALWEDLNRKYLKALDQLLDSEDEITSVNQKYYEIKNDVEARQHLKDDTYRHMENFLYVRHHEVGEMGDNLIYKDLDLLKNRKLLLGHLDELIAMHEINEKQQSKIVDLKGRVKKLSRMKK